MFGKGAFIPISFYIRVRFYIVRMLKIDFVIIYKNHFDLSASMSVVLASVIRGRFFFSLQKRILTDADSLTDRQSFHFTYLLPEFCRKININCFYHSKMDEKT